MKILICTSTFASITHGPSKFVNNIFTNEYLLRSAEIRIITQDVEAAVPSKIYKINYTLPRIFGSLWEYKENLVFYKEIKSVLEDFKPDHIVFINALLSYWTMQRLDFKGKIIGFINDDEKLLNGSQFPLFSKSKVHTLKSRILERKAAKKLDAVITNSEFLNSFVQKEYRITAAKVYTLYKGVNLKKFCYQDRSPINYLELDRIKILFIKSDFERGGLQILWRSLHQLSNYNFTLIVCGSTPPAKLDFLSNASNVEVIIEGATSQDKIVSLLEECHILSIPALREGLGVANIEGLAMGIPVVSTRVGGIVEVLGNGKYGWLAEPNNSKDLAENLAECITSTKERIKKSQLGRTHVEEHFDREKMAINFYRILESI